MKGREEFIKIESIEDLVSFFLNKCIDQEEIYRGKSKLKKLTVKVILFDF